MTVIEVHSIILKNHRNALHDYQKSEGYIIPEKANAESAPTNIKKYLLPKTKVY